MHMITIGNYDDLDNALDYDEVWMIVRALQPVTIPEGTTLRVVQSLAPSRELFFQTNQWKKFNEWSKTKFDLEFAPRFLEEIKNNESAKKSLNELKNLDENGKKVLLVCFCRRENMCHRSIVCGILQGMGCKTTARDYSDYYNSYIS